jgi:maleate cis-trans isomerase
MAYTSWRGVVGCIKPGIGSGSLGEMIRLLPEGIGIIPLHNTVKEGKLQEFYDMMATYERLVDELAEQEVDLIHPEGTPSFMLKGWDGEAKLIASWEKKHGIPMFTSGQCQVHAAKALKVKNLIHVRYTTWDKGDKTTQGYFRDAGVPIKMTARLDVDFAKAGNVSAEQVYSHIKKAFLNAKGGGGIYIQGSGWDTMSMTEMLEQDLGVPVVSPVAARIWEIQKRLHVRQPIKGYGALLAELPR